MGWQRELRSGCERGSREGVQKGGPERGSGKGGLGRGSVKGMGKEKEQKKEIRRVGMWVGKQIHGGPRTRRGHGTGDLTFPCLNSVICLTVFENS